MDETYVYGFDAEDEKKYGYAVCGGPCCTPIPWAIRVKRPEKSGWVKFTCPKCGWEGSIFLSKILDDEFTEEKDL